MCMSTNWGWEQRHWGVSIQRILNAHKCACAYYTHAHEYLDWNPFKIRLQWCTPGAKTCHKNSRVRSWLEILLSKENIIGAVKIYWIEILLKPYFDAVWRSTSLLSTGTEKCDHKNYFLKCYEWNIKWIK